jgi:hypothetical protein
VYRAGVQRESVQPKDFFPGQLIGGAPAHDRQHIASLDQRASLPAAKMRSWIHMVIFAATLTVTLYAVTDMEYPRLGLLRIENFDHFLIYAYEQMPSPRESVPMGVLPGAEHQTN